MGPVVIKRYIKDTIRCNTNVMKKFDTMYDERVKVLKTKESGIRPNTINPIYRSITKIQHYKQHQVHPLNQSKLNRTIARNLNQS